MTSTFSITILIVILAAIVDVYCSDYFRQTNLQHSFQKFPGNGLSTKYTPYHGVYPTYKRQPTLYQRFHASPNSNYYRRTNPATRRPGQLILRNNQWVWVRNEQGNSGGNARGIRPSQNRQSIQRTYQQPRVIQNSGTTRNTPVLTNSRDNSGRTPANNEASQRRYNYGSGTMQNSGWTTPVPRKPLVRGDTNTALNQDNSQQTLITGSSGNRQRTSSSTPKSPKPINKRKSYADAVKSKPSAGRTTQGVSGIGRHVQNSVSTSTTSTPPLISYVVPTRPPLTKADLPQKPLVRDSTNSVLERQVPQGNMQQAFSINQ